MEGDHSAFWKTEKYDPVRNSSPCRVCVAPGGTQAFHGGYECPRRWTQGGPNSPCQHLHEIGILASLKPERQLVVAEKIVIQHGQTKQNGWIIDIDLIAKDPYLMHYRMCKLVFCRQRTNCWISGYVSMGDVRSEMTGRIALGIPMFIPCFFPSPQYCHETIWILRPKSSDWMMWQQRDFEGFDLKTVSRMFQSTVFRSPRLSVLTCSFFHFRLGGNRQDTQNFWQENSYSLPMYFNDILWSCVGRNNAICSPSHQHFCIPRSPMRRVRNSLLEIQRMDFGKLLDVPDSGGRKLLGQTMI